MTLVSEQAVRDYIELNGASTSKYSSDTIGSNIRAAQSFIEKATGRYIVDRTATLKFTTEGRAALLIPGLRTASSVTLQGAALTADSTYYLTPDVQQSGIYTGIQFRAFGQRIAERSYLSNPEWFERNLDNWRYRAAWQQSSLPNDLVIAGDWGYSDASLPEILRYATKVQAAIFTIDAEGIDTSVLAAEIAPILAEWKIGEQAVAT